MRAVTMMIATGLVMALPVAGAIHAKASDAGWEFCSLVYLKGGADPMCNFRTLAQCEASTSGLGGTCMRNPNPRPVSRPVQKSRSQ